MSPPCLAADDISVLAPRLPESIREGELFLQSAQGEARATIGQEKVFKKFYVKPRDLWKTFTVEDFGLKPTDADSHCPALFLVRKALELKHRDLHLRSAEGKRKDAQKSARRKKAKKQRIAAQRASGASSSAAPAPPQAPSSSSDPEDLDDDYEVEV